MRYVWVGLIVVLIDLLGKLLASHGIYSAGLDIPLGALHLVLFGGETDVVILGQPLVLDISTGLALLVPLIAVLVLLMLARPLLMSYALFGIGVQLLAGSGLAEALTRFLYGEGAQLLSYDAGGQLFMRLSARHIAFLAGCVVLLMDQVQRRRALRMSTPVLQAAPENIFDLSGLLRGNDNVHIDVALSAGFQQIARRTVTQLADHYVAASLGQKILNAPSSQLMREFRDSYAGMVSVALNEARAKDDKRHIELLRLAVLSFLHEQIRSALADAIEQQHQRSRGALNRAGEGREVHQGVTARLLKGRNTVFYQVCSKLFAQLAMQEQSSLAGTHEVMLGTGPSLLFTVPLLQAASPEEDEVLMAHYALMGHRRSDAYSFRHLDELFNRVFPPSLIATRIEAFAGTGSKGATLAPSVFNVAENVTQLLDVAATREALRAARKQGLKEQQRQLRLQLRFQSMQLANLRLALEHAGLVQTLLAIYETPLLYSQYAGTLAPHLLNEMVSTHQSRLHIWRRLHQAGGRVTDKQPMAPILQASRRVRQSNLHDISAILLRFAEDFSAYRRDLQLYLTAQHAVGELRLVHDEREIVTARLNQRLYEFPTPDEIAVSSDALAGHVILKADLRGSTHITEELVRRELNPATYFSRNFYDPITALTHHFHGEKIFIEGDAMILLFLEPADTHNERLAVARACALAVRLLEMVARNNQRNAAYGLPPLELGIGITYQPGSPAYVFDGSTRIVISPAINRADRLSSSARSLRNIIPKHRQTQHVAVFKVDSSDDISDTQPNELMYNVNGIALEPAAFNRLGEEITLRAVLDVTKDVDGELYAAPWPPPVGKRRRLVIRRARVAVLSQDPKQIPGSEQPYYFEVIAAPALLDALENVRLGEPLSTQVAPLRLSLP